MTNVRSHNNLWRQQHTRAHDKHDVWTSDQRHKTDGEEKQLFNKHSSSREWRGKKTLPSIKKQFVDTSMQDYKNSVTTNIALATYNGKAFLKKSFLPFLMHFRWSKSIKYFRLYHKRAYGHCEDLNAKMQESIHFEITMKKNWENSRRILSIWALLFSVHRPKPIALANCNPLSCRWNRSRWLYWVYVVKGRAFRGK